MPTQINGSTGVSKVQDGVVVQADLAANVAGNGPAFRAYQNVAQSISSASSKVLYQIETFDTNDAFDVAIGRFQPSVAGYYFINAAWQSSGSSAAALAELRKNGAAHSYSNYANTSLTNPICTVSGLVYLNGTTDYVEIFASQTTTANTTATQPGNYFSGFLARAA